uniref:glutaminase n=1 Tax=Sinocyclocheilus rhinocerous TaxID=307959 RepID=A0A673IWL0_9TELE
MVETGAIICTSLLQVTMLLCLFVSVNCNRHHCRCSYQTLRKDIIHLHALSFYLQEKKCFPEGVGINSTLDLLLQCLSTEVTCESGAALAATLANGGLCPLSGDQVMSPTPSAGRSTLSMMQVAGMNDYSRMFHFKTSVPGKSSQSGVVLIVVPGVLGLMCCPFLFYRYLLSGADVNAVDYDGWSALHVAASEGRLDVIKFLVENAGANCTLKDRWGNMALQEAIRCNQDPAIQFLKKYTDYEERL